MLGLMENQLNSKNIPSGYKLCFNEECQQRDRCMHYQAWLLKPETQLGGILAILAKFGPTDGLAFDHYETGWDFEN